MNRRLGPALGPLRDLYDGGPTAGMTDAELLDRFADCRSEAAFEAIVRRHGPAVLARCRSLTADEHAALDAFQATFLVLVRRAGSIRRGAALGSWLLGVAGRTCAGASRADRRRRAIERRVLPAVEPTTGPVEPDDTAAVVRRELAALPDRFRGPLVLCAIEGLTHDEAAARLGLPIGTVRSRLARGRDRLRSRLVRRGLAPAAVAAVLAEDAGAAVAALPDPLVASTLRLALGFAAGSAGGAAGTLAARTLRSLTMSQFRTVSSMLVLGLLAGTAAVAAALRVDEPPAAKPAVAAARQKALPAEREVSDALRAWWEGIESIEFRETRLMLGPDGEPDPSKSRSVIEHAWAPGHKRAMTYRVIAPDGTDRPVFAHLDDGRTSVYLEWYESDPLRDGPELGLAKARNQTSDRDHYDGTMTDALWMLICVDDFVARPLHLVLSGDGRLEIDRDPEAEGRPRVVLTARDGRLRYELDHERGWLPRRLRDDQGSFDTTVTRFARVDGRWFPAELRAKLRPTDPGPNALVRIEEVRINRPIPQERFRPPAGVEPMRVPYETPGAFGPETLIDARSHPEDPAVVPGLVALLRSPEAAPGAHLEALELLASGHLADEAIADLFVFGNGFAIDVPELLTSWGKPRSVDFLRTVATESPHRLVRARAMLTLALALRKRAEAGLRNALERRDRPREDGEGPRPAPPMTVEGDRAAAMATESFRLLERLIAEYADVRDVAERGRRELDDFGPLRGLVDDAA